MGGEGDDFEADGVWRARVGVVVAGVRVDAGLAETGQDGKGRDHQDGQAVSQMVHSQRLVLQFNPNRTPNQADYKSYNICLNKLFFSHEPDIMPMNSDSDKIRTPARSAFSRLAGPILSPAMR